MAVKLEEIREFSTRIVQELKPRVSDAKSVLGFRTFGYRRFLPNGQSFGFSDNVSWNQVFLNCFAGRRIMEYENDLKRCLALNKDHYLRQGLPEPSNAYLQALYDNDIWNTVVLFKRNEEQAYIEAFFLGGTREDWQLINTFKQYPQEVDKWIDLIRYPLASCFDEGAEKYFLSTLDDHVCLQGLQQALYANKLVQRLDGLYILSRREWEVTLLLNKRFKRRQIAGYLNIAPKTVDANIEHIKDKLNLTSKTKFVEFLQAPMIQQLLKNYEANILAR